MKKRTESQIVAGMAVARARLKQEIADLETEKGRATVAAQSAEAERKRLVVECRELVRTRNEVKQIFPVHVEQTDCDTIRILVECDVSRRQMGSLSDGVAKMAERAFEYCRGSLINEIEHLLQEAVRPHYEVSYEGYAYRTGRR